MMLDSPELLDTLQTVGEKLYSGSDGDRPRTVTQQVYYAPKRWAARALAFAASSSRFFGSAVVSNEWSRR
jgi:hypothetical protein